MISIEPVQHVAPSKLRRYEANSKIHTPKQIAHLCSLVTEFGFTDPIHVDEDFVILAGHGRLAAANQLRLDLVPVVQILGLTETQKQTYRIAHNQSQLSTGFDAALLKTEIQALVYKDYGADLLGFTESQFVGLGITIPSLDDVVPVPEFERATAPAKRPAAKQPTSTRAGTTMTEVIPSKTMRQPQSSPPLSEPAFDREAAIEKLTAHNWSSESDEVLSATITFLRL